MKAKGAAGFEQHYSALFADRWPGLKEALLREPTHTEFRDGLLKPYFLDPASRAVALALGVQPGHITLDMCAAPGGKCLVLARSLAGSGRLVANERSATRRARLHRVINEHLPERDARVVTVTSHDAARWALHEPNTYDRILADVPCSSERHVITSPTALSSWSPTRTKRIAATAYAIACAAADSLKAGGVMVYATCALSPIENDGVVKRLVTRSKGGLELDHGTPEGELEWEPTALGHAILPDRNSGAGPMYFARLCRVV